MSEIALIVYTKFVHFCTPGQFTRLLARILLHENMDYIDCIN